MNNRRLATGGPSVRRPSPCRGKKIERPAPRQVRSAAMYQTFVLSPGRKKQIIVNGHDPACVPRDLFRSLLGVGVIYKTAQLYFTVQTLDFDLGAFHDRI